MSGTGEINNSLSDPVFTDEVSQAMKRAIIRLSENWELTRAESSLLLGGIDSNILDQWKNGEYGLSHADCNDRMSILLGIHKALRALFSDPVRGYGWVKRKNSAFGGLSALDVMKQGEISDLLRVRSYLNSNVVF